MIEEAIMTETRSSKNIKNKDKKDGSFILETMPNQNLQDEKLKQPSKIKVSIELVPKEE